ncbi:MAG TPA: hypothetical protein VND45_09460 [Thermoanaerobaculia bacterium]|jgi:probable HAF family extracellular repeat protein|nr:hypothetical protein [Thermoanaerobaculia bacterium]
MQSRVALLLLVFVLSTGATIRDLGTLPGGGASSASAVNVHGKAVGWAFNAAGVQRAVLFNPPSSAIEIPTPFVSGGSAEAMDINDGGVVVGGMATPTVSRRAFIWSGGSVITDIGSGTTQSTAFSINNAKEIAGQSNHAGWRAVKWPAGSWTFVTLGTFGGALDSANAIAEFPRIAGTSRYAGGPRHAAIWDAKKVIDLGTLGGANSFAHGIIVRTWPDDSFTETYVVGESERGTSTSDVGAFLWTGWTMTNLGTLPGWYGSKAYSINKNLDVVGVAWDIFGGGTHHAVIWRGGVIEDLNTWISDPEWELQIAYGINDAGQIVGYGRHKDQGRAFLLEP